MRGDLYESNRLDFDFDRCADFWQSFARHREKFPKRKSMFSMQRQLPKLQKKIGDEKSLIEKKNITMMIGIFSIAMVMSGCGEESAEKLEDVPKLDLSLDLSNSKDGIFEAESSLDKALGRGYISIEIQDHKIVNVNFSGKDVFGNDKDENYGGDKDSPDYKKAQVAVNAMKKYPAQLLETQSLEKVDAISGATISYEQFVETVHEAVKKSTE